MRNELIINIVGIMLPSILYIGISIQNSSEVILSEEIRKKLIIKEDSLLYKLAPKFFQPVLYTRIIPLVFYIISSVIEIILLFINELIYRFISDRILVVMALINLVFPFLYESILVIVFTIINIKNKNRGNR